MPRVVIDHYVVAALALLYACAVPCWTVLPVQRIRGLPTNVLPGAGTPSVFPLSSFVSDTAGTSVTLKMYNVTLELPDYDYLALMALAQPALTAALNATALSHLAALRAGIQSFAAGGNSTGVSSLYVSSFQGWGINTTSIFFEVCKPCRMTDSMPGHKNCHSMCI